MNSFLSRALSYAGQGWHVLPLHSIDANGCCTCGKVNCHSPGKHPCTRHGVKDASIDAQQIHSWWAQWPFANVGIATGDVSGFFVLDVDPKNGGDASLDLLVAKDGPMPTTVTVRTGSGGRHFYFQMPDHPLGNGSGSLPRGLEIRANGDYVMAPPSRHVSGDIYECTGLMMNPLMIAPAPQSLLERILERRHAAQPANMIMPGPFAAGDRNIRLTPRAGKMQRVGLNKRKVNAALQVVEEKLCHQPLSHKAGSIARGVTRYPTLMGTQLDVAKRPVNNFEVRSRYRSGHGVRRHGRIYRTMSMRRLQ